MDSSEMEAIVKEAGWIPIRRKRRNRNVYLYVSKRQGSAMREHYVGPVNKLQEMPTEQFRNLLLGIIAK